MCKMMGFVFSGKMDKYLKVILEIKCTCRSMEVQHGHHFHKAVPLMR